MNLLISFSSLAKLAEIKDNGCFQPFTCYYIQASGEVDCRNDVESKKFCLLRCQYDPMFDFST